MINIIEIKEKADKKLHILSHAVEHSSAVVMITDVEGRIEYVNPKFTQLTGYSLKEVAGKRPSVLKSHKTSPELYEELWSTIKDGNEWKGEFCNRKKNRDLYWVFETISPIKNDKGVITNFISLKEDITEKKKKTERRINVQHFVSNVLAESNTIKDAFPKLIQAVCTELDWDLGEIWLIDQKDCVLNISEIWHNPSLEFTEFKKITWQTTFPPQIGLPGQIWKSSRPAWIKDVVRDTNFIRAAVAEKEGLHGAFGFPITNGSEVLGTFCFFSNEIRQPDREILDMLEAIGNQIGLFIKRMYSDQLLRDSEERYRNLIETAQDPIFCDINNKISFWSKSAENLFGYSTKEIIGKSVSILMPDKYKNEHLRELKNMLMTDASIIMRKTVEVSGITKEGVEIPIEISLTSQKINGREYLTTSIIRNLTERKKMEKELAKIQKFEFLELLANGIAHDFNNSLAGIMGNISLAKMDTRKSTIANERLIEAEKAILRTKNLVLQLLTFKKNGTPIKQAASIKEIIRESIVLCLRGSKTTGECSLPYNLWPVEIDVGQIGQVINNLIINASQAMPEGGNIKVFAENITLDTEDITDLKIGPYIKITVQDQGTGIPGDKIQSIFDPFFTTKKKGGGLGLTVCRSVIRKHDGHIDVKSEVGSGTSFTVYIPATQEAIDENREKRENGLKGFGKILVSDEDEQIRSTTSALLMCIGYKVDVAVDDEDAVTLYKEAMESAAPFDAVILDLSISNGMGGKKTIKEILKLDPDVKAIISSGCSNDRVMSHYREYGFSGALTKPFEIHDLNVILRNLIVC